MEFESFQAMLPYGAISPAVMTHFTPAHGCWENDFLQICAALSAPNCSHIHSFSKGKSFRQCRKHFSFEKDTYIFSICCVRFLHMHTPQHIARVPAAVTQRSPRAWTRKPPVFLVCLPRKHSVLGIFCSLTGRRVSQRCRSCPQHGGLSHRHAQNTLSSRQRTQRCSSRCAQSHGENRGESTATGPAGSTQFQRRRGLGRWVQREPRLRRPPEGSATREQQQNPSVRALRAPAAVCALPRNPSVPQQSAHPAQLPAR